MKCNLCMRQLSAYSDNRLNEKQTREVESHLKTCVACQKEYEALRGMLEEINALNQVEVPDGLHQQIMQKIRETERKSKKVVYLPAWAKTVGSMAAVLIIAIGVIQHQPGVGMKSESAQPQNAKMIATDEARVTSESEQTGDIESMEDMNDMNSMSRTFNQPIEEPLQEMGVGTALDIEEEWEMSNEKKAQTIEAIESYSETHQLIITYLPHKEDAIEVRLEKIENKALLLDTLRAIDDTLQFKQNEGESDHLKIIFK